ncbi:VC0807 family protein [Actinomadura macrotermitis]|uniref:Intracellular septation protein A n=1 Tax=Actinomadura macrotermitis TaxID=2585200 RepID=A0A7K0BTS8_9ACTN|nr:VC0807 family protein [Actinomadura macrotermitis]MQY04446.1 hypothetical protein [Actinomadura macrotermitis]
MTQVMTVRKTSAPKNNLKAALTPLVVDIAVPFGVYYLAHKGFGVSLVASLALSSVIPGARTVWSALRDRSFNGLAGLMLAVNLVGIALSFVTGDPRLMIAKDSGISSVIGLAVLVSAFRARPLMTAGLKPFITKGDAARTAAWDALATGSARFRTLERRYSAIWGAALLAECAVRVAGAFLLPVETMAWLSGVLVVGAIGAAIALTIPTIQSIEKLLEN